MEKWEGDLKGIRFAAGGAVAEDGDRQDAALIFFVDAAEIVKHALMEVGFRRGLRFHVDDNEPVFAFDFRFDEQVDDAFVLVHDVGENFLFQEREVGRVDMFEGGGEKRIEKFSEIGGEELFEELLVMRNGIVRRM
nr:hypothetical protein [Salsuginibacillus kocurii]